MAPVSISNLKPGSETVVADVLPNPPATNLVLDARAKGCRVIDGLGMLVNQGVIGIRHWTGADPTPRLCEPHLKKSSAKHTPTPTLPMKNALPPILFCLLALVSCSENKTPVEPETQNTLARKAAFEYLDGSTNHKDKSFAAQWSVTKTVLKETGRSRALDLG